MSRAAVRTSDPPKYFFYLLSFPHSQLLFFVYLYFTSPRIFELQALRCATTEQFWSERMQRSAGYGAEDSCLKNHTNNQVSINVPDYDVEKTPIKPSSQIANGFALKTQCPSDEDGKGVFRQRAATDSDASSLTEEKDDFPEGGLRGYCVIAGAFCGLFSVFGIINSTGILLEYFSTHQLKDYTSSQIGWIFGLSCKCILNLSCPLSDISRLRENPETSYNPRD
jgi:hypothetical protein